MDFRLTTEERSLLVRLRTYLDATGSPTAAGPEESSSLDSQKFVVQLGRDGWLAGGSMEDSVGEAKSVVQRWLILEELAHRGLPNGSQTIRIVAPSLAMCGTEEQRRTLIPKMLSGEVVAALAYTEPDAGTDLASLRTRATRVGDEYVITGQKVYITLAHIATHLWLAVRTDPGTTRHDGISILLIPANSPGITVRPMYTQADTRTNEVFLDDVRVPADTLVGVENKGWDVIRSALTFERAFTGSSYAGLARYFERLLEFVQRPASNSADAPLDEQFVRCALAELASDLHVAKLFAMRTACLLDAGESLTAEASINKVWLSELRQRVAAIGLDLMGEEGQFHSGVVDAPLEGAFDLLYRYSPIPKFAAGTNEVQRTIIAERGLGLPRYKRD